MSVQSISDTADESQWELELSILFCSVQIPQVRKSVKTENVCSVHFGYRRWESVGTRTIHSVLFSSDTTSKTICSVQIPQVKQSIKKWNDLCSPIQIPQVRESSRTETVCSVQFRYHKWDSQWKLELSVLSSSDTTGERVSENYLFCAVYLLQVR